MRSENVFPLLYIRSCGKNYSWIMWGIQKSSPRIKCDPIVDSKSSKEGSFTVARCLPVGWSFENNPI